MTKLEGKINEKNWGKNIEKKKWIEKKRRKKKSNG